MRPFALGVLAAWAARKLRGALERRLEVRHVELRAHALAESTRAMYGRNREPHEPNWSLP